MGSGGAIILIVVTVAAFFILRAYIRMRAEQRLRENPPNREWIELRLPRGTSDANQKMQSLYRKIAPMMAADPRAMARGEGVLDALYTFEVPRGQQQPIMHFFMACPPEQMPTLKRLCKQSFVGMVEVIPAKDPLAEARTALMASVPE